MTTKTPTPMQLVIRGITTFLPDERVPGSSGRHLGDERRGDSHLPVRQSLAAASLPRPPATPRSTFHNSKRFLLLSPKHIGGVWLCQGSQAASAQGRMRAGERRPPALIPLGGALAGLKLAKPRRNLQHLAGPLTTADDRTISKRIHSTI
jgi:hypothetical protein